MAYLHTRYLEEKGEPYCDRFKEGGDVKGLMQVEQKVRALGGAPKAWALVSLCLLNLGQDLLQVTCII